MNTCLLFNLYLIYDDEETLRPIAEGCSPEQLIEVLSRHLCLARVDQFLILPMDKYVPFHEFTL